MSNALAIATVTATLKTFLQSAAAEMVPSALVIAGRPRIDGADNGIPDATVYLYLYQVLPNVAFRTADLPTRRADGSVIQRPQSAWNLHYLISFQGNDAELQAQRMLGSVVNLLHAQPLLTRDRIRRAINDPENLFLVGSDLAEQVESVKFTPLPLNLEELSKLWSVFFQTPYTLSIAYQASVVLIDGKETPEAILPVLERNIYLVTFQQPMIDRVLSQTALGEPILANQPIQSGDRLIIEGKQLGGKNTQVRIGQVNVTNLEDVRDRRITLIIPPEVKAGVQGLQVVHILPISTPPRPYRYVESNIAAFVLRPRINGDITVTDVEGEDEEPRSAVVRIPVNPAIAPNQRVVLLLNQRSDIAPAAYIFTIPSRDGDEEIDSLAIPIQNVQAGTYLVRVQVNGAESVLIVDQDPDSPTFKQFIEPTVTIP